MSSLGSVLKDRYEIIAEIGKGGMSTVYLSRDKNLGSYWAIKKVKNQKTVDLDAFKKEVELLSSLNHSDVPRIVDKIQIDEDYYVVMDFISGTPLGKKVASEGPQKEKDVINWAKMLCDVLHYLHNVKVNPIVYRDMKPDNVMLTELGRVKLIDFGIAKECLRGQAQSGPKVGTKGYAAPEQYKGEALDERTDIYSLGVTLYNLVTGKAPQNPPNAIRPIREINPLLSEGLEYIINKCTQANPANRYGNCMELKKDLENINTLNSKYRKTMRNKLIKFSTSVVCFILAVILTVVGSYRINENNQRNYDSVYNKGINQLTEHKYTEARDSFEQAIRILPSKIDAYSSLYEVLLPTKDDKNYIEKTKNAIDKMKNYIYDSPLDSKVKYNPELLYKMIKSCLEVNDKNYAGYSNDFIDKLESSKEYKNGDFSINEIESYKIIATFSSKDLKTLNFKDFNNALNKLEADTNKSSTLSADDKLNNYYILVNMYSTYSEKFTDSYTKISEIGSEAKKLIDNNRKIKFQYIRDLYEIIAESFYDSATISGELATKRMRYQSSLVWFGYLDDLKEELSELATIAKADAFRALYETYNTLEETKNITPEVFSNLNKAESIYKGVLSKNASSFLAAINLTETYVDMISYKSDQELKTKVISSYNKVIDLKKQNNNLEKTTLSQFSSLKQQMENLSLGGGSN